MSAFYSSAKEVSEKECVEIFQHAVQSGITLFNSADFYGPLNEEGFGHNLRLLKKCFETIDRSKIQLMVKIGANTRSGQFVMEMAPDQLKKCMDYTLKELGTDYVDIVVLCRVSPTVPIEESVAGLKALVEAGQAKAIGLSETSAENLRKAHAVYPISCIEQEWSLWTRDIEEEIVPVCRELGIKIVAYSPLGRGFLCGNIKSKEDLAQGDFRVFGQPRFADGNLEENFKLIQKVQAIAEKKGCSVGQLSLAWVMAQGDDVFPIPGTTKVKHLDENIAAASIKLTADDLKEIEEAFDHSSVKGDRYAHMVMTYHGQLKQ